MRKAIFLGSMFLIALSGSGCSSRTDSPTRDQAKSSDAGTSSSASSSQADSLIKAQIKLMYDMADALEKNDEGKIEDLRKLEGEIKKKTDELKLSDEEKNKLLEKYRGDLEKAMQRMAKAVMGSMDKDLGKRTTGTLKGKVTFNGLPVKIGIVGFVPEKGKRFDTAIEDGRFELKKVPAGPGVFTVDTKHVLQLLTPPAIPGLEEPPPDATQEQKKAFAKAKEEFDRREKDIKIKGAVVTPTIYSDPRTSTLKFTVKPGEQEHNLELTGESPHPPR